MKFKTKIGVLILKFFISFLKLIGLRGTRLVARFTGSFFYFILPIRKKVVLENLAIAFPGKTTRDLKKIAHRTYQSITITFSELLLFSTLSKDEMKSQFKIENIEELRSLVNEKKGVILWTGHLGSWEVGGSAMALHLETPVFSLAKKQSNSSMNDLIKNAREAHGNKMIWLGASVRHLIEVLRSGGIVGVVGDQRGPADSPRVMFFEKPTPFYTGTATIICKTNCNAVLSAAIRDNNDNYKAIFEVLSKEDLPPTMEERISEINQRYASFLEKVIKQYPDQYFWMHKIWKY